MAWQQLHIHCTKPHVEITESLLMEAGALSISFEDAGDQPLFEPLPNQSLLWDDVIVTGLFDADAIDTNTAEQRVDLKAVSHDIAAQIDASRVWLTMLADTDWERVWMSHYHPIECANDVWIVPKWLDAPNPDATIVWMDPGLAFGTGYHATTRLCLDWLTEQDLSNTTVIDYGCGSGILGIAALLLGAKHVYAVDIDPQAVLATKQNAEQNQVADKLDVFLPSDFSDHVASGGDVQCDVLIANILAKPLMELAEHFAPLCHQGAHVVLSGLVQDQINELKQAYEPWFSFDRSFAYQQQSDAHWYRLSGHRR